LADEVPVKLVLLTAVTIAAFSTNAEAAWDVQNSGEDVFGNVNVTATSYGDNGNTMRFECGSSSVPFLAFLIRDSSGSIPDFPASFLHVDQDGDRHKTGAVLESWNERYVAVKVTEEKMLREVVEHMIVATNSVSVGVEVPSVDLRIADTFSPRGSTAAGNVLLENCFSR
jgi:hypothetical protein